MLYWHHVKLAHIKLFSYLSLFLSDNEEDRGRSSHNGQSGKEFKDEEETVTTKSVQIVQATETTATRKRGGVPSRKVDLGAAAQYTGDNSPNTATKQVVKGAWFKIR